MKNSKKLSDVEIKLLRYNLAILLAQAELELAQPKETKKSSQFLKSNLPVPRKSAA